MGVATARDIGDKLMADGVSPAMPVAVLERGTLPGSRALRTLLADLGDLVEREGVKSPAIIVVGEVVLLSDAEDRLQGWAAAALNERSEEHTSELQSLMRISYAVFCLKKKKTQKEASAKTQA